MSATSFPLVFFPPDPPVYGTYIPSRPPQTRWLFNGRRLTPPEGLADFVGEPFYPPLGTRRSAAKLNRSLDDRLEQYRARRNALVNALLEQCLLLEKASDDGRAEGLRAFAAVQAASLAALENEAEALRRELARDGWWTPVDWNARRIWRLESFPPHREWANLEAEFQVMRAAAYYEDGLVPAQRGLLRELAAELAGRARRTRSEPAGRIDSAAMYFSPETSRLILPRDLPQDVNRRIAAYNARKDALKRELRSALHDLESASRAERTAALQRLADDQWPHLANLETLADEIRADLAPRFVPQPPKRAPLIPTWLLDLITPYNEERNALFAALHQAVRAAVAQVPRIEHSEDFDEDSRLENEYRTRRQEAELQATQEFQQIHAERITDLTMRSLAIRRALEAIAQTTRDPRTGRPLEVESLLCQHVAAMDEFEVYGWATTLYPHYRTAMLQPGLSPEQRRLLFNHAVTTLAQPLPYGEPMPNRNLPVPVPR